jgi:adenylosuccinate lyase
MNFDTYLSPFTWRYGSQEMRCVWSEENKRLLWRSLWVALAEVQHEFGLVTSEQLADLRDHQEQVDVLGALEIESHIKHDLMAELKLFAQQAPVGGSILHLGATSADIEDNADVLRMRQAMSLVLKKLLRLLKLFAERIELWADVPLIGFTHLQPAEPTTLGYRLAVYTQDLFTDWDELQRVNSRLRGKGFRGAVGTGASYAQLLGGTEKNGAQILSKFEAQLSKRLNLPFYSITTQVYPRKQDYQVISALAGLGSTLYKFAFDLRILQSPVIGELGEGFGQNQVGSSAMPFKRNPIKAEKVDSLARALAQMPRIAWDNAAHSLLERTLDDSANRRTLLPESFLITDELLEVGLRVLKGLQIDQTAMRRNLATYGPFAGIERLLMGLGRAGADRQEMHEILRNHAMQAWGVIKEGKPNPLPDLLSQDSQILRYLSAEEILTLLDVDQYLGDASQRALQLAERIAAL